MLVNGEFTLVRGNAQKSATEQSDNDSSAEWRCARDAVGHCHSSLGDFKVEREGDDIYAEHTKQKKDVIAKALERDTFMSAEEAKAFGIVDEIIVKRE